MLPHLFLTAVGSLLACPAILAQAATAQPPLDATLTLASNLAGKALFLRGFYAADELIYEATGRVVGSPKVTDWTLAAVNIQKAERHGKDEMELTGLRVAIRYNQQNHQFERHPIAAEPMHLLVRTVPAKADGLQADDLQARGSEAEQFDLALAAIFSIGIDPALERSTPDCWRHYFDPTLPWDKDAITDKHILTAGTAAPNPSEAEQLKRLINPAVDRRDTPRYTDLALRDKVEGEIELRLVVDMDGLPRRFAITRPIGYGLDARAIETIEKWRFHPGMLDGKPVPVSIILRESFELQPH